MPVSDILTFASALFLIIRTYKDLCQQQHHHDAPHGLRLLHDGRGDFFTKHLAMQRDLCYNRDMEFAIANSNTSIVERLNDMNIPVILIEMLIFAILFTVMCFKTTGKNTTLQIHNYPPEIQEEYFKTHERIPTEPLSKRVVLTKGVSVLIFTAVLVCMALLAGARDFRQGFLFTFGMMAWIGAYDTFFMDWVLFANLKRFRLEGTEHMDKAYHQKWFHLKGMLFPGIVFALLPSALVGVLVSIIK